MSDEKPMGQVIQIDEARLGIILARWCVGRLRRRCDLPPGFLDRSLLENSSLAACVIRAVGRGRTMKRSKFTEAQIAFILRQAEEGTAVGEVCRKAGISEATYYNWRKKYAGLMPSEMKRLRQLEEENGKLKKIVADLSLDKAMLQDVIRRKF